MGSENIAMLGAGNMGSSLLAGMIKNGFDPKKIWVSEPHEQKLSQLKKSLAIHATTKNLEAIQNASCIILAVKPQIMHQVAEEIATEVKKHKPVIISIAAGLSITNFEKWFGKNIPLIRVMPNTAAMIGESASALYANQLVTAEQKKLAEKILTAVGVTVWVDEENQMDTVTSLSGNGPAYFFLLIEVLVNAAEKLGLPKSIALKLAKQTALGAAKLANESEEDVVTLRSRVTSPGGTTESAINKLEENHIREMFFAALNRSNERAKELQKG